MGNWEFQIYYDGECSICRGEAAWLRRLDRGRGLLLLTDMTEPDFDASVHGIDMDAAMRSIHGKWRDGRIVTGVEVFQAAYSTVGLGWFLVPLSWKPLKPLADFAYRVFAKYRLRRRNRQCDDNCKIPSQGD